MMESTFSFFQSALKNLSLAAVRGDRVFLWALFIPFLFLMLFLGSDWRLFVFLLLAYTAAMMGFLAARSLGLLGQQELKQLIKAEQQSAAERLEKEELRQTVRQLTLELMQVKEKEEAPRMSTEQVHAMMASHELKEPLRTIRSFIKLLGNRHAASLNGEGQDFLHFIKDAADRMQEMMEDVYAFSSISEGRVHLQPASINFAVSDTLRLLGSQIRASKAIIEVEQLPETVVDQRQFVHLLQNLVTNAIKYCKAEEPKIKIYGTQQSGNVLLKVKDNGIGIAPEFHQEIFEIFRRLHGVGEYPGSGIGLAICKKIVDNHGGAIWVESEGEGKGSTFCVSFPGNNN